MYKNGLGNLDLSQLGFKFDDAYATPNQYGAQPAVAEAVAAPSPSPYIERSSSRAALNIAQYQQKPATPVYQQQAYENTTYALPPKAEAAKMYAPPKPVFHQPPPSPVVLTQQQVPTPQPAPIAAPTPQPRVHDTTYATTAPAPAPTYFSNPALFPNPNDMTLRKLGQNEKIFHGTPTNGGSYIFRAALVTSQIDLYKNMNILREGIDQWKLAHPLLRARVLPRGPDKIFTYATEEKVRSFENVKFLVYRSNAPTVCDEVWKLVVEKETTQGMDGENGLLWRLTFLQLRNKSTGEFQYAIIIAFDHSIMDGRSSYASLLELMSIIEGLYTKTFNRRNKQNEIKEILPPKEELFAARQKPFGLQNQLSFIKAPTFIDLQNSIATTYIRPKQLGQEEEQRGMVYHYDGRQYAPLSALIQVSKLNNSKFRTLTVSKADMSKLLAKCKENGVKMTSCLNIINSLAIRMIYEKFDQFTLPNTNIQYVINVSLRESPEYQSYASYGNYDSIGCYIGLALSSLKENLSIKNPNWMSDFWKLCKVDNDDFHHRLERGDFIHFGNSNLGVMQSSITDQKLIKIRKAFATGKYSRDNFLCWYSNLISTVDGELCWTVSYNTYFIRQELIDALVENVAKIVWQLAQVRVGTN